MYAPQVEVTGTIDVHGGRGAVNGGTVKVFHCGAAPSAAGLRAGRTLVTSAGACDDGARRPLIRITAADAYELFVDGSTIAAAGDWGNVETYELPSRAGTVIGVRARDAGGMAALLAEIDLSPSDVRGSKAGWKVWIEQRPDGSPPSPPPPGWNLPGFDDRGWADAAEVARIGDPPWGHPDGIAPTTPARWIWSRDSEGDEVVDFRVVLSPR